MKVRTILTMIGLGLTLAAQSVLAVPGFVSAIPNGGTFSCANCHVNGMPPNLNPFGNAFLNNN